MLRGVRRWFFHMHTKILTCCQPELRRKAPLRDSGRSKRGGDAEWVALRNIHATGRWAR